MNKGISAKDKKTVDDAAAALRLISNGAIREFHFNKTEDIEKAKMALLVHLRDQIHDWIEMLQK